MIPVLLLLGLLAGRWAAVPLAALAWPLLLALGGVGLDGAADVAAAAGLAAANTAIGVVAHKGLVALVRAGARTAATCRRRHSAG
ncbi:MAG TPA: hypothetical protein VD704_07005 [Gaiellaceae bacterium]|nr:hypothetical protein [Gaiellaceae bacterium]